MELYVNPQITGFRQDVDGTIKELKIGSNKEDAWENIAEQGASAKLDNNKTATINVSTYTEPVEVLPTSGKNGMKKATITLSNIPSGGELTLDYPSWLIEGSEMNSVVPNGVKSSITDFSHSPNVYLITGDGVKTLAELTGCSIFNNLFGTCGQSVAIEVANEH